MHKKDIIKGLKSKLLKIGGASNGHNEHQWWRGQGAFARFLVHYLENLSIPSDEKYDFWHIEPYLPQILVDAFEELRTGTDLTTAQFRKRYEEETGHAVPNVTELGASAILEQGSAVQTTLGFMLREVTGHPSIERDIDAYCNAQKYVLQQTFDKFLRLVYRRGLYAIADKCEKRGMSGTFGETELRTFIMAGRIMFTFAKRIDKRKPAVFRRGDVITMNEHSVSFVGEDDDPLGLSSGLQSVHADLGMALSMIEEVIAHWPQEAKEQKRVFRGSASVALA